MNRFNFNLPFGEDVITHHPTATNNIKEPAKDWIYIKGVYGNPIKPFIDAFKNIALALQHFDVKDPGAFKVKVTLASGRIMRGSLKELNEIVKLFLQND